jgi:RNA polymerase sigma-70 factor (ECF subfamily)
MMTELLEKSTALDGAAAVSEDFMRHAEAFRPELLAHCYRMLGSIHDAEDLVQETYLRAWRSRGTFEGRASLRTWLYRIATNACLTALHQRARRPMPSGLGGPSSSPEGPWPDVLPEVAWLQPFPDRLAESDAADPASIVAARAGMRLALITALQLLAPRQRAVLILREVLGWRAADVAELLDITVSATNSLLQRARIRLAAAGLDSDDVAEPGDAELRSILDRYATAFETADVETLLNLLTADAVWEMPPQMAWFRGTAALRRLLRSRLRTNVGKCAATLMLPTRANGQPAFGMYFLGEDGMYRVQSVQVLTFEGDRIARVSSFRFPGLAEFFGLPPEVSAAPSVQAR